MDAGVLIARSGPLLTKIENPRCESFVLVVDLSDRSIQASVDFAAFGGDIDRCESSPRDLVRVVSELSCSFEHVGSRSTLARCRIPRVSWWGNFDIGRLSVGCHLVVVALEDECALRDVTEFPVTWNCLFRGSFLRFEESSCDSSEFDDLCFVCELDFCGCFW